MVYEYDSYSILFIKVPQYHHKAEIFFLIVMVTQHLKSAAATHRAASGRPPPHMGFLCTSDCPSCVPGLRSVLRPTPKRADSTLSIRLTQIIISTFEGLEKDKSNEHNSGEAIAVLTQRDGHGEAFQSYNH